MAAIDNKTINVEFTGREVVDVLMKQGLGKEIAETIAGNLLNNMKGTDQVIKALLGIYPKAKYKVGEFVYVMISSLPSWKMNAEATSKLPSVRNGSNILAQIIDIDLYTACPYHLKVTVVTSNGKMEEIDAWIGEWSITSVPEKDEEILGVLEKLMEDQPL